MQRLGLGDAASELEHLWDLRDQQLADVPVRNQIDIGEVVRRGFAAIGAVHDGKDSAGKRGTSAVIQLGEAVPIGGEGRCRITDLLRTTRIVPIVSGSQAPDPESRISSR